MGGDYKVVDVPKPGKTGAWDDLISAIKELPAGKAISYPSNGNERTRTRIYQAAKVRGVRVHITKVGNDMVIWRNEEHK